MAKIIPLKSNINNIPKLRIDVIDYPYTIINSRPTSDYFVDKWLMTYTAVSDFMFPKKSKRWGFINTFNNIPSYDYRRFCIEEETNENQ